MNPDGSQEELCEVCGVDHRWSSADLSHGIIRLLLHAQEHMNWMEFPANGDMIARQRAGVAPPALLYSVHGPEDFDWDLIAKLDPEYVDALASAALNLGDKANAE